jgi:hypothetical protein
MKLKNYQKRSVLEPKITKEEFQSIKGFLPHGTQKRIAVKTGRAISTVSNTFKGLNYNKEVAFVVLQFVEKYKEAYAEGTYSPRYLKQK